MALHLIYRVVDQLHGDRFDELNPRRQLRHLRHMESLDKVIYYRDKERDKEIARRRAFEDLLDGEISQRYLIDQIAIDSPETELAEQAIGCEEYEGGFFHVAVSFPDVGILDPGAESLERLARSLKKSPSKQPDIGIPEERSSMMYNRDRLIPSLTVQGIFRVGVGFSNINIIRTATNPDLYTYHDEDQLMTTEEYPVARKFAHAYYNHHIRPEYWREQGSSPSFKNGSMHPAQISEQFILAAKTMTGQWMHARGMPLIATVFDTEKHRQPFTRAKPGLNSSLKTETHVNCSNPGKSQDSWIINVLISKYLAHEGDGDPVPLSRRDLQRFANWQNEARNVFDINGGKQAV